MVGRRLQSVAKRHVRRDGCLSTRLLVKLKAKVKASHEDLDFILLCWSELADDATADALLKKLRSPDWIAALYILTDVLPVLSLLSRTFQQGSINFSQIQPSAKNGFFFGIFFLDNFKLIYLYILYTYYLYIHLLLF